MANKWRRVPDEHKRQCAFYGVELDKADPKAVNTLTPDEQAMEAEYARQMDEAYLDYVKLADAYRKVIELENDPQRKAALGNMLEQVHEDNK